MYNNFQIRLNFTIFADEKKLSLLKKFISLLISNRKNERNFFKRF